MSHYQKQWEVIGEPIFQVNKSYDATYELWSSYCLPCGIGLFGKNNF